MKGFILLLLMSIMMAHDADAQNVGIGTHATDASSKLEINSSTFGLLIPRLTTTQRTAISNPANGL